MRAGPGATRVAAISRYIPGVNLGELLKGFGNLSSEKQRELHPVLVGEIADGLCDAVAFCHSKGHGHGELTVRNIMVTPLPSAVGRYASVVLIDFDNRSTFENRAINEAEFKASDCRQLRMLLGCLTDHTPYRDQVQRVLAASPDCHSVTEAFKACGRLFCGFQFPLVATQLDSDFWFTRLKEYVLLLVFQRFAPEWRAELDHLAETLDTVSSLQQARSRFDAWLADGGLDTFVPQATLTVTKQPIRDALQAIAAQTSSTTK